MKKFLLLLLLITSFSYAQLRDKVVINRDIFTIVYSEVLEQPLQVNYKVLCPNGSASRKGMNFYKDKEVKVKTSDDSDYYNNDYDKGHLAPAADFNCSTAIMIKTFTYLNCSLQKHLLNDGVWKTLEERERYLARKYNVNVQVDLHFSISSKTLTSGATVPDSFTKTITYNGIVEKYYFKNEDPKSSNLNDYKIK